MCVSAFFGFSVCFVPFHVGQRQPPHTRLINSSTEGPKGLDPAASGEGKPPHNEAKRKISLPLLLDGGTGGTAGRLYGRRGF